MTAGAAEAYILFLERKRIKKSLWRETAFRLSLLEPVFILKNAGWARDFFARRSQFDAGILDVLQGNLAMHGGPAVWAC